MKWKEVMHWMPIEGRRPPGADLPGFKLEVGEGDTLQVRIPVEERSVG
jgi:hypothetical protein